jgi:outer membrane protein assembly factor BamB
MFLTKYNSTGTKQWTRQLGVSSKVIFVLGVATDASGNIFLTGQTNGGIDGNSQTGIYDFFLTKYDSTGTRQWTKQLGVSSKSTLGQSVKTDSSGNIFVAGYTNGNLDGNTLTGTQDFFLTKFDSTGAKKWTKQLGVASKATYGYGAATDSSGNIFVAGYTTGSLDGNTLTGLQDLFVTKYDPTGVKLWTQQLGVASKYVYGYSVASDSFGNVFVTGYTTGSLDGNALKGTNDLFVTKFDSNGVRQWTRQIGAQSAQSMAYGIAVSFTGNFFVGGNTTGGLDRNTLMGKQDFFVSKFVGN